MSLVHKTVTNPVIDPVTNPTVAAAGVNVGGTSDLFEELGFETLTGGVDTEGFIAFTKEMDRLSELPESKNGIRVKTVAVSGQMVPLPIIALTATVNGVTLVFSLLIEAMLAEPLEPVVDTKRDGAIPGGGYEIITDRPTIRCYGPKLRDSIGEIVSRTLNIPVDKVEHVYGCVVGRDANLESDAVARMFYDTGSLAIRERLAGSAVTGITNTNLTRPGLVVRQRTKITPATTKLNRSGSPIYCDFTSKLELSKDQQDNNNPNAEIRVQQQKYTLADVSGFIDFNVTPVLPIQPGQMIPETRAGYIPSIVLTEVSGLAGNGRTIEDLKTQLLGMTTVTSLTTGHGWVRVFEDWMAAKGTKTSIGFLGVEHDAYGRTPPVLGPITVKSLTQGSETAAAKDTMTPLEIASKWCTEGVAVAIDIEEGGRLEWIQNVFMDATMANGDADWRYKANAKIIAACDELTGGHFSQLWLANNPGEQAPVVDANPITIHMGTYNDSDGNEIDIRSIDYLTMLSLMPKDLDKLATATTAMLPGGCNPLTLTERRKAITTIAPNTVFKGLASRVYMAPGFIQTLIIALGKANVHYLNDDTLAYGQDNMRSGMDAALATPMTSGNLYQSSYGNASSAPGFVYNNFVNPMYRG